MADALGMTKRSTVAFDPADPDLLRKVVCYLSNQVAEHKANIGLRVSSIFVILIVSTAVTLFPVAARRTKRFQLPKYAHSFARCFGAGVILSTGFSQ